MDTPTQEPEAIVARLYLPKVKSGSAQRIYGASGTKYSFKPLLDFGTTPVREYTSFETFEREELDIRKNTKSGHIICTLIGSSDPIQRARETVLALIEARLKVTGPKRLAALNELAGLIALAAEGLRAEGVELPAIQIAVPASHPMANFPPIPPPAPMPQPPAPSERLDIFTQPQLQEMAFDDLKTVCRRLEIKIVGSREDLVEGVLAKQGGQA